MSATPDPAGRPRRLLSRRQALGGAGLAGVGAAAAAAVGALRGGRYAPRPRVAAGTGRVVDHWAARPDATGEWWVPPGSAVRPLVVLVHGGYWQPGYDRHLEDAVAADLAGRGYLCFAIDYRAADAGWPATFTDVAAALDFAVSPAAALASRVDPARVALLGHSAGGHLVLWAAGRHRLPPGAPGAPAAAALRPALVLAQAPVAALTDGARLGVGGGAAQDLVGGSPEQVPARYAVADPVRLLPAGVPTRLLHGADDTVVPLVLSETYTAAAVRAGDDCQLLPVTGGHFAHLDPRSAAVAAARSALAAHLPV